VQIYNEKLQDMFVPTTPDEPLKIIADGFRDGVFCNNLYEVGAGPRCPSPATTGVCLHRATFLRCGGGWCVRVVLQ
jgi:hypothetical protein